MRDQRMIAVDRIPAAGVVAVVLSVVMIEDVVRQRLEMYRWPARAAFAGVIEDHIQNDAKAGRVECLHEILEFAYRRPVLRSNADAERKIHKDCNPNNWYAPAQPPLQARPVRRKPSRVAVRHA